MLKSGENIVGEPSDETRSSIRPPDDQLTSWKDIAAHFERDVTTVQRWEKREGMPVHRHLHDKAGSVFAFRSELDAWARGRHVRASQESAIPADPVSAGLGASIFASRRMLVLGVMAATVLTLAAG